MFVYVLEHVISAETLRTPASNENAKNDGDGAVGVDDEMLTLVRFDNGATGSIEATRNAHGRNNFIIFENSGEKGSVAFNCERTNELEVMFADDPGDARGFRTVYTGPSDPYGGAPGDSGARRRLWRNRRAIVKGERPTPNFRDGYRMSQIADAILRSGETQIWTATA